jgi:lipoprotein NlpD
VSRTVINSPKQHQRGWLWPAEGRVATSFVPQQGKKGIDIAGHKGQKIRAAGDGTVAYAGNGLSGYGNLIIIKHDNQYLTAYGNNLRNLVKEGQRIHYGQTIADMGIVDRRFWGVHFEMRRAGKPVNPMDYLK